MKRFVSVFLTLLLFFVVPPIFASVGVGVGTGRIVLDEELKPGLSYELPSLTVYNTGDEPSDYYVSTEFSQKEGMLEPNLEWFTFTPPSFFLEPNGYQIVKVDLRIPMKGATPGEYFAFLTAQPKSEDDKGSATVGVAAACKLYFTVAAANIFQAIYYVALDLFARYKPWSIIVPIAIILFVLWKIFRKRFKIQVTKNN